MKLILDTLYISWFWIGILERTLIHKESQSVMIVGSPGCGKKLLVRYTLEQLKPHSTFICIHLHGAIVQDEISAFAEIIRQLVGQQSIPNSIKVEEMSVYAVDWKCFSSRF